MGAACSSSDNTAAGSHVSGKSGAQEAPAQPAAPPQPDAGGTDNLGGPAPAVKDKLGKRRVREVYKLGKTLGTGGFSVVKLATHRASGEEFACKVMALPPPGAELDDYSNTREDILKEIEILCQLEHKNIIFLKEFFDEGNKVYLITELLTGGELLDAVLARGSYTEEDARKTFANLLSSLDYLHKQQIAHRDLKLENLLLVTQDDITNIKLADFGLAKVSANQTSLQTVCGTPQYVAPEVINEEAMDSYGIEVDMWSAGVVLFVLLGGYPPFYDESEPRLFAAIQKGEFEFGEPVWDEISEGAKDLISKLICVDIDKRLTASESLNHPWVTGPQSTKDLVGTRENMENTLRKKFKAKVKSVIAANRMKLLAGAVAGAAAAGQDDTIAEGDEEEEDEDEDEDKLLREQGVRVA